MFLFAFCAIRCCLIFVAVACVVDLVVGVVVLFAVAVLVSHLVHAFPCSVPAVLLATATANVKLSPTIVVVSAVAIASAMRVVVSSAAHVVTYLGD